MIDYEALNDLDHPSLVRLADLLESNLLTAPFTKLSLQSHISEGHVASVAAYLNKLAKRQVSTSEIALIFRSFAALRKVNPNISDLIDIVVSGPDVAATARDTGVVIRQLFNKAKERVLAVGYAVYQGRSVFRELAERLDADESLEATLCLEVRREQTDTSLDSQVVGRFANNFIENEWPGIRLPRLYYDPRSLAPAGPVHSALHAKCVVIDGREALVTSANFTEAAQDRNIELGMLVNSPEVAGQIERHFHSLIRNGHLQMLPLP
ncbi:MAG: DISARM system phospholipase D-like protein DrmC [Gemmatimonadota bacterium]|nr:DISARM system phospholipase D-like protein DrmC [Gemmatimonadota bacterium]